MRTRQAAHRQPELIDRRRFGVAALALLGGAAISMGCGGGSSPTSPSPVSAPPGGTGRVVGSVSNNHPLPHIAILTAEQLSAGAGVTLDISNGLHSHTVTLTAVQIGQIAAGAQVSGASSTDPHSGGGDPHEHTVTFN